jgi:hypothetical protein
MDSSGGGIAMAVLAVYLLVILFLYIVPMWRIFGKAGKPGWGSIVPIYNIYLLCQVCGRPGWWLLLMLIPFINIIVGIVLLIDLAKVFGKGVGFAIGLILLSFVFFPILGYGKAAYSAPAGKPVPAPATA